MLLVLLVPPGILPVGLATRLSSAPAAARRAPSTDAALSHLITGAEPAYKEAGHFFRSSRGADDGGRGAGGDGVGLSTLVTGGGL